MKNIEIDILSKILTDFEEHLSQQERLLKEFRRILDNERCSRRIQGYQRDPEYYKRKVQAWKKANPERAKGYQKKYQEKKKTERASNIRGLFNQGKTVLEIAGLLNISEKTVLNCLKQSGDIPSEEMD